ncbi:hypothetical protein VUN82_11355 [Micrococcaceae bacterium Sec5.1]
MREQIGRIGVDRQLHRAGEALKPGALNTDEGESVGFGLGFVHDVVAGADAGPMDDQFAVELSWVGGPTHPR